MIALNRTCLKRDAIPSVFSFAREPKKPRISGENRESRQRVQELRHEVGVEYRTQTDIFLKLIKLPEHNCLTTV